MILFINCCVRKESRTRKLADTVLNKMDGEIEEVRVWEINYPVADEDFLKKRDGLIANAEWDNPMFNNLQMQTQSWLPRPIGTCRFRQH